MKEGKLRQFGLQASLIGSVLFGPALSAYAQEAPQPSASATQEEIVVTARKRAERLLDVPVAINALGAESIERYAASNLDSVGTLVPQVMFTRNPSGNGANINIRGVGTNTSADDGIEQAVSVNMDGVPTARGRILQMGLFDIGNVQILKGPQALYFGKNSPGGTIVVESNGPTDEFEGYIRGGYEMQAAEYIAEAAISGPLTDTLSYRLAVRGADMTEGYIHNVAQPLSAADNPVAYDRANGLGIPGGAFEWAPNSKQLAGRLTLQWEPTDAFDATFKLFVSHYEDQGDTSQNVIASCEPGQTRARTTDFSGVFDPVPPAAPSIAADPQSYCGGDRRENTIGELPAPILAGFPFNDADSEYNDNWNYLSSVTMNWTLPNVTFTSVTGYYRYTNVGNFFADANLLSLAGGAGNSYSTSWNQELRFVTTFDGPFNLSGGAFYADDSRTYRTWSMIIRGVNPADGLSVTSASEQRTEGETYSFFAEASWDILPNLELAAGARYTHETKDGTLFNTYRSPQGGALNVALAPGIVVRPSFSNNDTSPQVTLTYHPTPNMTLFAGYRTGFKAGAITNPGLLAPNVTAINTVIQPEEVTGYDAGLKFQTDDRRFSGDITIYDFEYDNLQVSAFDSVSNTVRTQNAGGATVQGVEANVNYLATDELALRAAVGYNEGRYGTFTNAAPFGGQTALTGCTAFAPVAPFACVQQNLTGRPLPRAPDWTASAGASWDTQIAPGLKLGLTGDVRYVSDYNFIATDNPFAIQDGYTIVDASVRLYDVDDIWEVALVGKNLTDEFYFTVGSERPLGRSPGSVQGVPGLPTTVLLQATYNF